MNTLKITDRKKLLTERHNLETAGIWELEIQGKKRKMYSPCNLNIVIGRMCNCDCGFCFFQGKRMKKQISDEAYLAGLEAVMKRLRGLPVEITITGGEPTLYPERLIHVLEMVKKYGFSHRTFSTNGTGLLERVDGKPLMQYMKETGCIYNISLSRMAVDEAENRRIFRGDTIRNGGISQAAVFAEVNGMDLRLSCNLLEGSVDGWEKIREYMDFYGTRGITSFLFREIIPPKKSTVVLETADRDKKHVSDVMADDKNKEYISVSDIVAEMKQEQGMEFLKTAHGMVYDVDIYGFGDKLIKHYQGKPGMAQKGCAEEGGELVTSLIYEEGELRTTW